MKNRKGLIIGVLLFALLVGFSFVLDSSKKESIKELQTTVLSVNNSTVTLRDSEDVIYTFNAFDMDVDVGDNILVKYTGVLDECEIVQDASLVDYKNITVSVDEDRIPISYKDGGIFSDYYVLAYNKLQELSLDEKIGQLLLVRYFDDKVTEKLEKYKFSGFVFYEKDFKDKTKTEVQKMINSLQKSSEIPLLTAVDEEGGDVVRIGSNPNLVSSKFKSSKELYNNGGFKAIKEDTINKSKVLNNLGLNLNLAPVVDVATDPNAYIYPRTIGEDVNITSEYAKTVIEASKGTKVSYTLKHFPGYGNNLDTHISTSTDTRSYENIMNNDIKPFESGIEAGAEAVLVSHNIVTSIDKDSPASLSTSIHNLLRSNLNFTGVIIADDISMGALSQVDNVAVKAILAGNDLIITTDYETSFNSIKNAINENKISEELIDKLAFRVLAWKYYKGLMIDLK